jgi:hypothetical protein
MCRSATGDKARAALLGASPPESAGVSPTASTRKLPAGLPSLQEDLADETAPGEKVQAATSSQCLEPAAWSRYRQRWHIECDWSRAALPQGCVSMTCHAG